MVGGVIPTAREFWLAGPSYTTAIPNLWMVSDTTSSGGIEGLTRSALLLANKLTE
jgi:phytoene dehydrogenase-like protein